MVQAQRSGVEKPMMPNIVSDGALAVIAGSDTTAGALAVIFYHLVRYPSYRVRLQSEIDFYSPPPAQGPLDMSVFVNMPYLNACM
jgi:cytochrome P450